MACEAAKAFEKRPSRAALAGASGQMGGRAGGWDLAKPGGTGEGRGRHAGLRHASFKETKQILRPKNLTWRIIKNQALGKAGKPARSRFLICHSTLYNICHGQARRVRSRQLWA